MPSSGDFERDNHPEPSNHECEIDCETYLTVQMQKGMSVGDSEENLAGINSDQLNVESETTDVMHR